MITGINELKTFTKHISCECKCRFDERKRKSDQWWNNNKCQCECNEPHVCGKDYFWNPPTCNFENGKYLASIMDDSVITCDEIIESYDRETKTVPTNFNEKNITCRTPNFYILLAFLLITMVLLIVISIYSYQIKYRAKQKHLLPFYGTNNELREILY